MTDKLSRTNIKLPSDFLQQLGSFLQSAPSQVFCIPTMRDWITRMRLAEVDFDRMAVADTVDAAAIDDVVAYNKEMLRNIEDHQGTLRRPELLVNVLTSIFHVRERIAAMKVLCIGPRTESEIFMLMAAGFDVHNITGLDLMSYSDFVDVGDMHAMPYADDTFDIVMVGWTLTYSNDMRRVDDECCRVARPCGYVALGVEREPVRKTGEAVDGYDRDDAPRIDNVGDMLALFGDRVHAVPLRHDAHRRMRDSELDMVMAGVELL